MKEDSNPYAICILKLTTKWNLNINVKHVCICAVHAKLLLSCLTLGNPMDHNLLGSSVHAILQARILEWVAVPSSRGSSQPRN